jgi:hypothetical protein
MSVHDVGRWYAVPTANIVDARTLAGMAGACHGWQSDHRNATCLVPVLLCRFIERRKERTMDEKAPSPAEPNERRHGEGLDVSRMIDDVKNAMERFQTDSSPENFAQIVTALGAIGLSTVKVWDEAAAYTKKHPLIVAFGAGVMFFAFKGLFQSRKPVGQTYH